MVAIALGAWLGLRSREPVQEVTSPASSSSESDVRVEISEALLGPELDDEDQYAESRSFFVEQTEEEARAKTVNVTGDLSAEERRARDRFEALDDQ